MNLLLKSHLPRLNFEVRSRDIGVVDAFLRFPPSGEGASPRNPEPSSGDPMPSEQRQIYDCQDQILALSFRSKLLICFKVFPLRSEADLAFVVADERLDGVGPRPCGQ